MAEKTVLRRPQDIDAVINRGGSSAGAQEENQEKERIFNLRVPESLVAQVDALRKRRTGSNSRSRLARPIRTMSERVSRVH
jgi:hypothetical protein